MGLIPLVKSFDGVNTTSRTPISWGNPHRMIDNVLLPRLKAAIEAQGNNYKAVSKKARLGETAVRDIVVGRVRNPGIYTIDRIAAALGTSIAELLTEGGGEEMDLDDATVPLLGYVGGGEEVYPYNDLPLLPRMIKAADREELNCEWVPAPPGRYPNGVVALRVTGGSMKPFMPPGTIVYYANRFESVPDHCVASLCVVQLRDEKALLKLVRRGHTHGKFDLHSYSMPTMVDQELAWCAPVIFIKPTRWIS